MLQGWRADRLRGGRDRTDSGARRCAGLQAARDQLQDETSLSGLDGYGGARQAGPGSEGGRRAPGLGRPVPGGRPVGPVPNHGKQEQEHA